MELGEEFVSFVKGEEPVARRRANEDLVKWFSLGEQSVFEACSGFEARRKGKSGKKLRGRR